jgi:hypothetical protein
MRALDDHHFIPFGLLIAVALSSMLIVVVGHVDPPLASPQLIALH